MMAQAPKNVVDLTADNDLPGTHKSTIPSHESST